MISIVACCHSAKLCAHAARDFQSQQCHPQETWNPNFAIFKNSKVEDSPHLLRVGTAL